MTKLSIDIEKIDILVIVGALRLQAEQCMSDARHSMARGDYEAAIHFTVMGGDAGRVANYFDSHLTSFEDDCERREPVVEEWNVGSQEESPAPAW